MSSSCWRGKEKDLRTYSGQGYWNVAGGMSLRPIVKVCYSGSSKCACVISLEFFYWIWCLTFFLGIANPGFFRFLEVIAKKGISYVTVNDLVTELTPVARRLVPDSVKQELVDAIRKFLPKDSEDNDDNNEWSPPCPRSMGLFFKSLIHFFVCEVVYRYYWWCVAPSIQGFTSYFCTSVEPLWLFCELNLSCTASAISNVCGL